MSATGWRRHHPDYQQNDLFTAYWDRKEAAEDVVRQSGIERWTIFKPAYYMDNWLPGLREDMFPDLHRLPEGKLVTSDNPRTALAVTNAEDLGAAVAAAVAYPDTFDEAEIELAGDLVTFTEVAEVLSAIASRAISPTARGPFVGWGRGGQSVLSRISRVASIGASHWGK